MREFLSVLRDAVMLRPDETRMLLQDLVVGRIRCAPLASGDYHVRFQVDPSVLLNATSASPGGLALARGSCGGAILTLANTMVVEEWVPKKYDCA